MPRKSKQASADSDGGLTLSDAAWKFAPAHLRGEARREKKLDVPRVGPNLTQEEAKALLLPVIQGVTGYLVLVGAPANEMRERLVEKLRKGSVVAFGIETKPNLTKALVEIAPHMFDDSPKVIWSRNVVENFGVRYEHVRVHRREHSSNNASAKRSERHSLTARPGRPTKDREIKAAIRCITDKMMPISAIARKEAYSAIKEQAREMGFDTSLGYSDPVLQRVMYAMFGARGSSKPRS